jgi:hypothetical protein
VRLLVRGLYHYRFPQHLDSRLEVPALLVEPRQLDQQRQVGASEPFPLLLRPTLVAVLGQQVPGVQTDGGPVRGGLAHAPRRCRRLLEGFHVHPQRPLRAQRYLVPDEPQVAVRRGYCRSQVGLRGEEGAAG